MRRIAILAVLGYRLIPVPVRLLWSAKDGGSSGKALSALRNGAPVGATFRRFAVPHFHGPNLKGLSWNDFEVRSGRIWEPPSWDN